MKDIPQVQAKIIKKIFDQVKGRFSDGEWYDFKGKISVASRQGDLIFEIECEFKLDGMFFTLGKSRCVEEQLRILLPDLNRQRVLN